MKMQKKQFRIGELAKQLKIEQFIIRFWEKEFQLDGYRSNGGQRYYQESDIKKFQTIKELLYEQKLTIAGAKKIITRKITTESNHTVIGSNKTNFYQMIYNNTKHQNNNIYTIQIMHIKTQLLLLKKLLDTIFVNKKNHIIIKK